MADIPKELLDASTAFTIVRVGYFDPFNVKIGQRNKKKWCCLFISLIMRLLYIEVATKLDADSCLNAIKQFIARSGKLSTMGHREQWDNQRWS